MSGGLGGLHTGGIGENHLGLGGGLMDRGAVGTDHFGEPSENHVGTLAGVHPGVTNFDHSRDHRRVREENATTLLCEDAIRSIRRAANRILEWPVMNFRRVIA